MGEEIRAMRSRLRVSEEAQKQARIKEREQDEVSVRNQRNLGLENQ